MKYFSFLICFHEKHTDIFLSGFPVGVVKEGKFYPHQIVMPSGNLRNFTIKDVQNLVNSECPFASMEDLNNHIVNTVNLMVPQS